MSVSLPPRLAERVRALADSQGVSISSVLAELIGAGLQVRDEDPKRFLGFRPFACRGGVVTDEVVNMLRALDTD